MIPNEYLSLWTRIQQFAFDDEKAAVTFSGKLAAAQNWSPAFTRQAIEEYRKFLLLCCIAANGAAPSQVVDEVWHLHLTYTRSYWNDLCKDVLGRDLHHYPSAGGEAEDARHRDWYKDTLQRYRDLFDAEPPADIWPRPVTVVTLPDVPRFNWNSKAGWGIAGVMALPFVLIGVSYGTILPFALAGQHFLVFFAFFALALFASYAIVRTELKRLLERQVANTFPTDVTPFQVAAYLYGKHRALQAGIVDLIQRGYLEVSEGDRFRVKSIPGRQEDPNPLLSGLAATEVDSLHSYEDISGNWYDRTKFVHPALDALDQAARRKEPFLQENVFAIVLYGVVLIRMVQGILNNRPIGYLVIETFILSMIFFLLWQLFSLRSVTRKQVGLLYAGRTSALTADADRTVPLFALQGTPAIAGFAEGALLIGMFDANQSAQGSSGSGSSCSGGSSCSSGSSCGGGGCGGCSGS